MSELTQAQLVAEAEKVNAERTPGPWTQDGLYWLLRYADKNMDPDAYSDGALPTDRERDATFIAFCGTHMGTLLSLLASEGERVKALERDAIHLNLRADAAEHELDKMTSHRDRLAAEVERLKNLNCSVCYKAEAEVTKWKGHYDEQTTRIVCLTAQWEAMRLFAETHRDTDDIIAKMAELEAQR